MNAFVAVVGVLLCASCSPSDELAGCLDEEPSRLGAACAGDGECGNWLVCGAVCELPPAVSGEGGSSARIVTSEGTTTLRVEVARGDLARSRGLGNRPCIADGWGMILEYPGEGDHLITAETMRFPIDIAMAGGDGVVHTVHRDAPPGGDALYGGSQPVRVVLELAAGTVEIEQGAQLEYE